MKRTAMWAASVSLAAMAAVGTSMLTPNQDITAVDEILFASKAGARSICGPSEASGLASRRAMFLSAAAAYADTLPEADATDAPPIIVGLGEERLPVTTDNPAAETYFEQGVSLVFGFNHGDAIRAFQQAQKLDPNCAMCFWGEAFALGPHINGPRDPSVEAQALAAAQRAKALADGVSDEEMALINALQVRYSADENPDGSALDTAFADAMIAAADAHPDSDEILALAAEAIMDEQPWDYWEADGVTPKGRTAQALAFMQTVLERNPYHAPSMHLFIHLTKPPTIHGRLRPSRIGWRACRRHPATSFTCRATSITASAASRMPSR